MIKINHELTANGSTHHTGVFIFNTVGGRAGTPWVLKSLSLAQENQTSHRVSMDSFCEVICLLYTDALLESKSWDPKMSET